MMSVFIDTGFVIALFSSNDIYHATAQRWLAVLRQTRRQRVTTAAILLEIADGFIQKGRWHLVQSFLEAACEDPLTTVVPVDCRLLDRARLLKEARADKDWGITDCISFIVMQDHGMTEALAADRHFLQAGFRALLRDS